MKFLSVKLMAVCAAVLMQPGDAFAWNASLETSLNQAQKVAQVHGYTNAPVGHTNFCRDYPQECISHGDDNRKIVLTQPFRKHLEDVNQSVNRQIRPVSDQEQYDVVERWTYPVSGQGDCEDYVLLKKKRLVASGWPSSALLITVVRDELGEGHAILTVRTDRGDLVLDNKRSEILAWHETGYFFIKRQSASDPSKWVSLIPLYSTPTVAASGTQNAVAGD